MLMHFLSGLMASTYASAITSRSFPDGNTSDSESRRRIEFDTHLSVEDSSSGETERMGNASETQILQVKGRNIRQIGNKIHKTAPTVVS